jgi:hypothetical protein
MPLTDDHVHELIRGGESERVEFKVYIPNEDVIARVLIAFANTDGGTLILGVKDDSTIVGIPDDQVKPTVEKLRRICRSLFHRPVPVATVTIGDRRVVYAHVGVSPPEYRPVRTPRGEIFVRKGAQILGYPEHRPAPSKEQRADRRIRLFVAMSFREAEEPALVDYWNAMQRSVTSTGLLIDVRRIDLVEGDYEISQEVMNEINEADIVLADFTLNPRNVYFELGYARAAQKRIIQTARKETALEFDARNWRTLFYRNATELESNLVGAIEAAYATVTGARRASSGDPLAQSTGAP